MPRTLRELFVDRTRQTDAFRKMLDGQTGRRVMVVTAGPGLGKSWLLRIFAHEAAARGIPRVQIDLADGLAYDGPLLIGRARDAIGPQHFAGLAQAMSEALTARVAFAGAAPAATINASVGESNTLINSTVTTEVGTIVKENVFVLQSDALLARQALEDRLNLAFFESLAQLGASTRVALIFDSYERASIDADGWSPGAADRWIAGQLLARVRDGGLPNVVVVLAGRRAPPFGVEWNEVLGRISLDPLACDDVKTYLRERRGLSVITDAEADRLCQAVAGSPQVLGLIGDNLEQANATTASDDDW